ESTVRVIRALPDQYDTVEKAINYMSEIDNTLRMATGVAVDRQRQVAEVTKDDSESDSDNEGIKKRHKHGRKHGKKNGKDKDKKGDDIVRNYTAEEWQALSHTERDAIREARQARSYAKKEKKRAAAEVATNSELKKELEELKKPKGVGATMLRK
ncbi:MAG: hypothetical protein ACRCZI_08345, partial [Cetobacterium sp.]